MDKERRKKIQTARLIITEVFMLIIIILTVITLTFIVMGYRLNEDGELEQSGLIQIDSLPTGATVAIDGETLDTKTNTSKILPEGSYTVSIQKDGYTSWEKTVKTHPGLLTRLSYPSLYKLDRKTKDIKTFEETPYSFVASPNRNNALIFFEKSPVAQLVDLGANDYKSTEIDLTKLLGDNFSDLKILDWNKNGERVIISFTKNDSTHYAVIDLTRPDSSLDISETFNLKISALRFENNHGDKIFLVEEGHLRTISFNTKQLSGIIAKDVESFFNSNEKVAIVTKSTSGGHKISLYDDNTKSTIFLKDSTAENVYALVSEYIGRGTLAFLEDGQLSIYRGELPSEDISSEKPLPTPVGQHELDFQIPDTFETQSYNQIILISRDNKFTVFDLENYTFSPFTLENNLTFWPDEYTIGVVSDNKLIIRDFDGLNRLELGDSENGLAAVITKNNKYLYHMQKKENKITLIREEIR